MRLRAGCALCAVIFEENYMKRVLLLVSLCAGLAFGQAGITSLPVGPSYQELQAHLGLSASQLQELTQLQTTYHQKLQGVWTQIAAKQRALDELIASGSRDAAAIGTLHLAINDLQKEVRTAATQNQTAALIVLNADQKVKLNALDAARKLQPAIGQAMSLGLLDPGDGNARILPALGGVYMGNGPEPAPGPNTPTAHAVEAAPALPPSQN